MRILFLTQIVPYPPVAGPKIKTWNVLRHLGSQGHEIVLASFVRQEEEEHLDALKRVCSQVHAVPIRRSRIVDGFSWMRSNLTRRPFLVERDDLPAMRSLVNRLLTEQSIDSIHADQISMAQFALDPPGLWVGPSSKTGFEIHSAVDAARRALLVFDAHNATWSIVERMLDTLPGKRAILKPMLRMEARRIKSYEGMIVKHFDHTLAVTEIDRQALIEALRTYEAGSGDPAASLSDPSISVIPIAVDTVQRLPVRRQAGSTNILTLGTLYYPPNADGIRWFARDVFPLVRQRVPAATLTIVGKNPPQDFVQMAEHYPESIRVTGYVPELEPYLEAAALVVVPVRAGSGMRVRILEMFAHAMPVVTTTIGLEGIEAQHGQEVLVADTPNEFAGEVARLLQDPSLQEQLAVHGRRLAEEKYDWKVALSKLENIYAPNGEARG